jgi:hypothetical protein
MIFRTFVNIRATTHRRFAPFASEILGPPERNE